MARMCGGPCEKWESRSCCFGVMISVGFCLLYGPRSRGTFVGIEVRRRSQKTAPAVVHREYSASVCARCTPVFDTVQRRLLSKYG